MLNGLIPALLVLVPTLLIGNGLIFFKKRRALKQRNPLSKDLLRSPGESIRAEIDDITLDLMGYLMLAQIIPLMLYGTYISLQLERAKKIGFIATGFYVLVGLGMLAYLTQKIWRMAKRRNKLTLGYEAELAVAQELNAMAYDGYWIFHDFPADKFNIDHVLVGPAGVFAIETKGRSKPIKKNGKAEWNVKYDGKSLSFPGWTETEPLLQAQRQAKWLMEWLSKALGENVAAKPVLMLPGWYIDRTSGAGIMVLNGKNTATLLGKASDTTLPQKIINQIVHQLDQRCRTVKPRAYTSGNQTK